ncbi:MAG: transglycosylase domain-containing protein [Candidatus Binatia bacterium]|nr:transglycosylase domain-containing protein [Candidatus Binatia bacterium]
METTAPPLAETVELSPTSPRRERQKRLKSAAFVATWVFEFLCGALCGAILAYEFETSAIQARVFSDFAKKATFAVAPGISDSVAFPVDGPFDARRGYVRIPEFIARLYEAGYRITAQARQSPQLAWLVRNGIAPPYQEPAVAGLVLRASDGTVLLDATSRRGVFQAFEEIPRDVIEALLFIENRELLNPRDPRSNPAVEWDRLAHATVSYIGRRLGFRLDLQGGSTLAVQLEKFRHSPEGRTAGAGEKLRQIVAASLKAYRLGEDTTLSRRQIILDYLNTLPLAAVPGVGEVNGLGEGLRAWFGVELEDVLQQLSLPHSSIERAKAFKQVLLLLSAVRAPSDYLLNHRQQLEERAHGYLELLVREGKLHPDFARSVRAVQVEFSPGVQPAEPPPLIERKGVNALRTHLMRLLGISNVYDLHQLHLTADSTVDTELQQQVTQLLLDLKSPEFVSAKGLKAERLLRSGDPSRVTYSLLLFERTPQGNVARVHADNLDQPFDINDGVKLELGSTAKARTLAHYLEIVEELYKDLHGREPAQLIELAKLGPDPLTQWVAGELSREPTIDLEGILNRALERRYSASPGEVFFTGGGVHTFSNFDRSDDSRILSVREALRRSTNLVFIRLMRDLVRYHQARLNYNVQAVLTDPRHPVRQRMLQEIAEGEALQHLRRSYWRFRRHGEGDVVHRLLGSKSQSPRHLAVLFFAWNIGSTEPELERWLQRRGAFPEGVDVGRLFRAYRNPRLNLADFGYLLGRHPVDVWLAGELFREPTMPWDVVVERSTAVRNLVSSWLLRPKNRRAQDLRLRIRIEQDAFARMTPYWQRLGFPFGKLVPSLATAIGSSSDRPIALADFVGILVNDGVRRPLLRVSRLHFAADTPYETVLLPASGNGERVLSPVVARLLRQSLAEVVEQGTARRLRGVFVHRDGTPALVGGKTGSGDNRYKTFRKGGGVISAKAVSRTATFLFFIDDRFFGVVTASVPGPEAAQYEFTSALPVTVLKLAAPAINARM